MKKRFEWRFQATIGEKERVLVRNDERSEEYVKDSIGKKKISFRFLNYFMQKAKKI